MKSFILSIIISVFLGTGTTLAQGLFSITYDIAIPLGSTGDFINASSFRGLTLEGRGFINDNLSVGGSVDWQVFYEEYQAQEWTDGTKTVYGKQYRYINSVPIMATAHYYINDYEDNSQFYVGGGLGIVKIEQRTEFGTFGDDQQSWRFGFAPEVGVLLPINLKANVHLAVKYQFALKSGDYNEVSYLSFKIGLAFMN